METGQNSGTVPNIKTTAADSEESKQKTLQKSLGSEPCRVQVQIKGARDINEFLENVLDNQGKPLVVRVQVKDVGCSDAESRFLYLKTMYQMVPPGCEVGIPDKVLTSKTIKEVPAKTPPIHDEIRPKLKSNDDGNNTCGCGRIRSPENKMLCTCNKTKEKYVRNIGEPFTAKENYANEVSLTTQLKKILFPCRKTYDLNLPANNKRDSDEKEIGRRSNRDSSDRKNYRTLEKESFSKRKYSRDSSRNKYWRKEKRKEVARIELEGRRFCAATYTDSDDEFDDCNYRSKSKRRSKHIKQSRSYEELKDTRKMHRLKESKYDLGCYCNEEDVIYVQKNKLKPKYIHKTAGGSKNKPKIARRTKDKIYSRSDQEVICGKVNKHGEFISDNRKFGTVVYCSSDDRFEVGLFKEGNRRKVSVSKKVQTVEPEERLIDKTNYSDSDHEADKNKSQSEGEQSSTNEEEVTREDGTKHGKRYGSFCCRYGGDKDGRSKKKSTVKNRNETKVYYHFAEIEHGKRRGLPRWPADKNDLERNREKSKIPVWIPSDTKCRCSRYFADQRCKCLDYLREIGVEDKGPLYVISRGN